MEPNMLRKLAILLLAAAGAVSAATLSPVQLLNPAGSTAGQAIVSTGPSTAPGWATVIAGGLTPIGANTVYGNFTGSSASPAANAVPSCSAANSALKYTTSGGLSCGTTFALTSGNLSQFAATTSAQLLGVLSDETGSGLAVFGTSPSLTTPTIAGASLSGTFSGTPTFSGAVVLSGTPNISTGAALAGTFSGTPIFSGAVTFSSTITPSQTAGIVGTTTNNNANAGSVGEHVTSTAGPSAITTATITNLTSISLTAGDWEVSGNVRWQPQAADTQTSGNVGISTTSGANPSAPLLTQSGTVSHGTGDDWSQIPASQRLSLASTTTVYLVVTGNHSGGTLNAHGIIRARRVR